MAFNRSFFAFLLPLIPSVQKAAREGTDHSDQRSKLITCRRSNVSRDAIRVKAQVTLRSRFPASAVFFSKLFSSLIFKSGEELSTAYEWNREREMTGDLEGMTGMLPFSHLSLEGYLLTSDDSHLKIPSMVTIHLWNTM